MRIFQDLFQQTKEIKIATFGYVLTVILFFFYSFTQIDLGLTLTRFPFWQNIQRAFQYIGYFDRPLSTFLFIILTSFLTCFYLLFLIKSFKNQLHNKYVWIIVFFIALVCGYAYNAFSYDLFNYIFDAKIVTFYHDNPYIHKALDYPKDPMLGFMHWTHRVYPYGPTWLLITIPLSFLSLNFFLVSFFLFKTLSLLAYIGCAYYIGKISHLFSPGKKNFSIVFFALNPLVITESLISSHNDIVMIFFVLLSLYLILQKKIWLGFGSFVFSTGIKFATAFFIPAYIFASITDLEKQKNKRVFFFLLIFSAVLTIVIASLRTNFQPWYLLYLVPFVAIFSENIIICIVTIIISSFALAEYTPFLYVGNWDPPIPSLLFNIRVTGVLISLIIVCTYFFLKKSNKQYKMRQ